MGHNRIYRRGPTLAQCKEDGVTHLRVVCLMIECKHQALIALDLVPGPRSVPVNRLGWRCKICRQSNISVSVVKEKQPVPVFDLAGIKPHPRRSFWQLVAQALRKG